MSGRKIVVTGSSRGLGRAMAEKFLEGGDSVAVSGRDAGTLSSVYGQPARQGPSRAVPIAGALDTRRHVEEFAGKVVATLGSPDVLVLNLGGGAGQRGWAAGEEEWDRLWNLNFNSSRWTAEFLIPHMNKKGRPSLLFISSIAGLEFIDAPVAYSVAKAALIAYAKILARQLSPEGIRVNVICPGNLMTAGGFFERKRKAEPQWLADYLKNNVPLQKTGDPKEVAELAYFLTSEAASFMTGSVVVADGGQVRSLGA